jgi:hypothetical protein
VRKAIERVFGILKKRFRILKIPLPCRDVKLVDDIVHCCCILHNMMLMDKGRMNIGHLQGDDRALHIKHMYMSVGMVND